jgi:hypothetical protein
MDNTTGFETSTSGSSSPPPGGGPRAARVWAVRLARISWVALLTAGVVGGYGSALVQVRARAAYHHRLHHAPCHTGQHQTPPDRVVAP